MCRAEAVRAPSARAVDAIVLAGGTGRRLGGVSKPDVLVAGERMLDRVLRATGALRRTCVVAPDSVVVPADALRTLEDPPGGGPVAGIAAGLEALAAEATAPDADADAEAVLVLACDMPGADALVPGLLDAFAALDAGTDLDAAGARDGAIAVGPDGRRQPLAMIVRSPALAAALAAEDARGRSVRSLVAQLDLADHAAPAPAVEDVDTWEQHAAWERRLGGG